MESKRDTAIITLRIEKDLLNQIDQDAKEEHRSRTAQIIHMISKYYKVQNDFSKP